MKKISKIIIALIIVALSLAVVKLYDEYDYYSHKAYALEHNCEWQWNSLGQWTVCK